MRTIPHTIAILLFSFVISFAQITGPEQDCIGAMPLCNMMYVQSTAYGGVGEFEDIKNSTSCLENEENNSVWYTFEIADSGVLEFTIASIFHEPDDTIDYDFSLFDITGKTCADLRNGGLEVRCNYAFTDSITGLRTGDTATVSLSTGPPFLAPLAVTSGQTFALLIDNFSSTTFGFILDFSASTASFVFVIPPAPSFTVSNFQFANDSLIKIQLSSAIPCSSIAADGSDFSITGATPISVTGAWSPSCSLPQNHTQTIFLHYTGQLIPGETYTVIPQTGTDSNNIVGPCGDVILDSTDFVASDSLISSAVPVFNDTKIQLLPNPTSGKVIIKTDVSFTSHCHIEVVDVFGKQVYINAFPLKGDQIELQLDNLTRGVYFLRLSDSKFTATKRFTIYK